MWLQWGLIRALEWDGNCVSSIESSVANLYQAVRVRTSGQPRSSSSVIQTADCPAASAEFAEGVIGFRPSVGENLVFFEQRIEFPTVLRLTKTDVEIESRLRLVGRCVKHGCPHWMGSCVLGHTVAAMAETEMGSGPACSILDTCRWRRENGTQVCKPCGGILNVVVEET